MNYPTLAEVEAAERPQIARWFAELPIAHTSEEMKIIDRIYTRYCDVGASCSMPKRPKGGAAARGK